MFKEIQSGLNRVFGKYLIPIIVLIVFCVIALYYTSSKSNMFDLMSTGSDGPQQPSPLVPTTGPSTGPSTGPLAPTTGPSHQAGGYTAQAVAQPSDLLPHDQNSQWANLNPIGNGAVAMPDLLQAGYHIGLDTIGQTLKNANLQLRSDPIIEKKDIGPWNQSTYEADYGRVPLEVGQGPR
jgi:hypothetical protein